MEKKVYFKLHKVKKQWVTIAVTGLALGLSFASLGYVNAAEQTPPISELTVESNIQESAIDVISSSTNEVITKPEENKSFDAPNTRENITETTSTESDLSTTEATVTETSTSEINSQQALRSEVSTVTGSEVVSSGTSDSETNTAHKVEESPVISGGHYTSDSQGNWYYIKDEKALTGMQNIDNVTVYFDADGKQVKGDTRQVNGATYHFEKDSGQLTRNAFASDKNGNWYYLGQDGKALIGKQVIDNIPLYFYPNGVQAKDAFVVLDGNSYYFQKDSGQMVRDRFWSDDDGNWYYSDKEGKLVTGEQTIDGFDMYFYPDGVQAKGEIVTIGIEPYYFDKDSGHKVINTDITINGKTYHAEANGLLIETEQKLPQRPLVSGGHFQEDSSGNWYYYTATGEKLKGWQNVDGVTLYFDKEGRQAKNGERIIDGSHYYFSHYSGAVKTNYWHTWSIEIRRQEPFAKTYNEYYGSDGRRYYGWHRVGDQLYYFDYKGRVENDLTIFKGQNYLFDNHGKLVKDAFYIQSLRVFVGTLNTSYRSNKFGQVLTGEHHINGDDYYFSNSGSAVTAIVTKGGKDYYYFEGKLLKNYLGPLLGRQELDYDAYYSGIVGTDKDGVLLTGVSTANNGKLYYFENIYFDNSNIPKMFTVTTPTWKTIDDKLYHLEPSINRTYKSGRSRTYTVREEVDIINHGVRTKTDKIKRIIRDNYSNLYYLDENNDFYIGHLLPENTDLTKIEETVIQSDNKFYAFNRTSSLSETSPLTVSKTLVYNKKAYLIDDKGVATETKLTNRFEHDDAWNWYYFDNEGKAVTGLHSIDNVTLYFDKEGKQAKGRLVEIDGQTHYFDRDSGAMWTNRTLELNGIRYVIDQNGYVTMNKPGQFIQDKDGDWAYIKENGQLATGLQIINHQKYYFDPTGKQAKGKRLLLDGKYYFFDNDTGAMFVNKFHETGDYFSKKYTYFGEDGSQIFGWATIDGKRVYFKEDGYQVRNDRHKIGDFDYFFKKDGSMLSDDIDGDYKYYYADKDGHLQFGWVNHNNETYYISPPWGAEDRTYIHTINEKPYLLGPKGRLLRNTATDTSTSWNGFCISDENGVVKTGVIRLEDNRLYYFNPEIYMTTPFSGEWAEFDGKLYHFENPISVSRYSKGSPISTNTTLKKDGKTYIIDENGVATEKKD